MTTETQIATKLVKALLAKGYAISVYDGEAFALKRSTDRKAIMEALQSTDSDTLVIRNANGERIGFVLLIWGNDTDLISDYSDNATMGELLAPFMV